jgi:hypothetical protein
MNQTSKNKTNLDSKQILAIQGNDVSLFDSFAKFAKAINNKDLSQTFSLALNTSNEETSVSSIKSTTDTNSGTILAAKVFQPLAETDILSIADTNEEDQNIPTIAAVAPSSQKSISTEKQIDVIKNKFNTQFVQSDLQEISIAYL